MDVTSTMKADILLPALAVNTFPRSRILASTATATATGTVSAHVPTLVTWPPSPTSPPPDPFQDLRLRQTANTICGYIDGNPGLPATCSVGSHCVLDSRLGVIGCCPDGGQSCTQGVFTECVDGSNGKPQTVGNPYIFTCTGAEVCYKNVFEGGYSQYGCDTSTDLGRTVLLSATGIAVAAGWSTVEVSFTRSPEPATPSIPRPSSFWTSEQLPRPPFTLTSSINTTSTHSLSIIPSTSVTSATVSATPAGKLNTSTVHDEAAIIAGTIAGAAFMAGITVIAVVLRRRRANAVARSRSRPKSPPMGPRDKPMQLDGASISALLYRSSDSLDTGPVTPTPKRRPHRGEDAFGIAYSPTKSPNPPASFDSMTPNKPFPPPDGYHYPGQYPAVYARTSLIRSTVTPVDDRGPLTREMDEFFGGFQSALGRIGEEDEDSSIGRSHLSTNQTNSIIGSRYSGASSYYGDMRPLWQQNRRRSRSVMWV